MREKVKYSSHFFSCSNFIFSIYGQVTKIWFSNRLNEVCFKIFQSFSSILRLLRPLLSRLNTPLRRWRLFDLRLCSGKMSPSCLDSVPGGVAFGVIVYSPNGVSCDHESCQQTRDQSNTGTVSILILQITDEHFDSYFVFFCLSSSQILMSAEGS